MKRSALKPGKPLERKTPLRTTAPMQRSTPVKAPRVRTRKCAVKTCRMPFAPKSAWAKACSVDCAITLVQQDKAKAARKERQEGLAKLKTRRDYLKEAQRAFNAWVRERDEGLPCICCGRTPVAEHVTGGSWDAGHYRSVGSAPHLRFHEDNCHRQTKQCNQFGAGRAVDYRLGLIARIGLARVEALEADQAARKYSAEELQAITAHYKAKLRELRKSKAII